MQLRGSARRAASVAAAVLWVIVAALGIDILGTGGLETWLVARGLAAPAPPTYEARGRHVDVAGRSVYLDCRGTGATTVILESGLGGTVDGWGTFLDGVAAITRVCAWDRPGLGRSEARGLHTGLETADDLVTALSKAGERGPFVVVAHSMGGIYARLFAAREPDARALVMLDTYDPDLGMDSDPALPAEVRAAIRQSIVETGAATEQIEELDWDAMVAELRPVTELPGFILADDPHNNFVNPDPAIPAAMIDAWYRAIAAHYPNLRLEIVANSGHFVHIDQPALVLERIRAAIAEANGT